MFEVDDKNAFYLVSEEGAKCLITAMNRRGEYLSAEELTRLAILGQINLEARRRGVYFIPTQNWIDQAVQNFSVEKSRIYQIAIGKQLLGEPVNE